MKTEQEHSNGQCTMNNVQWKKVKLGECCTIHGRIGFRGYTTDDLVEKGYGAITFSPSDIHNFKLCYDDCDYITWKKYEESPEIKVFNGDILFCKTASIGKCAYVEGLKEKATINPQFVVLKNFQCDSKFLFYKLISYGFQTQVQGITGGSTIKTMSQEKLSLEEISVPDLPAQRRIAAILASADKVIAATQKTIAKYKQIKQGMMEDLLNEQCTMNNEQWEKVKLGECCDKITDGCHIKPKCVAKSQFLMLSSQNIKDNKLDLSDVSYLTFDDFERENHRTNIKAGDVLLTIVGTVGRTYLVKENDVNFTLQRSVAVLAPKATLDSSFLLYTLNNLQFVLENEAHGCAQKGIYLKQLNQLLISIPDLPAQRRIAAILSGIDAKIAAEEKVLQKYEKVKKGLMERMLES